MQMERNCQRFTKAGLLLFLIIAIAACSPPQPTATPTATATFTNTPTNTPTPTATSTPTSTATSTPTYTSTPTDTPTATPTFTPTPIPGITAPLVIEGKEIQFTLAVRQPTYQFGTQTYRPNSQNDEMLVVYARMDGVTGMADIPQGLGLGIQLIDDRGRVSKAGIYGWSTGGTLNWVFVVAKTANSFTISLPGDLAVELSPIMGAEAIRQATQVVGTRSAILRMTSTLWTKTPTRVATGTQTRAPTRTQVPATVAPTAEFPTAVPLILPTQVGDCPTHIVVAGDTVAIIAMRYGVTINALLQANNLTATSASLLKIGDRLIIPVPGCNPPAAATEVAIAPTQVRQTSVEIMRIVGAGDLTQEGVQIRNTSGTTLDLTGWMLTDSRGNMFSFPAIRFFSGGTIFVYTRAGRNTPIALFWGLTNALWMTPGERITLIDNAGVVRAEYIVPAAEVIPTIAPITEVTEEATEAAVAEATVAATEAIPTEAPIVATMSETQIRRTVEAELTALVADITKTAAAAETNTARLATRTPTPNLRATAAAILTATAMSWTKTPTLPPTLTLTPSTTPTAVPTVKANADWQPVTQVFDGVEMVLVPPGCFMMGSDTGERDEKPAHPVCFDKPFWIDKFEVTNGQFDRLGGQVQKSGDWHEADRPRETITWGEAQGFCALRGARLPTEAEWEYVARGPDNLLYPWGNSLETDKAIHSANSGGQTANVGSKPGDLSWVGAMDLSGNVSEWVADYYDIYISGPANNPQGPTRGSDRVYRGGSWAGRIDTLLAINRAQLMPDSGFGFLGFRCARSID